MVMTYKSFIRTASMSLFATLVFFSSDCVSKRERENWIEIQSFINYTFRVDPELKEQADLMLEGEKEVQTFDDILKPDSINKRKKSSNVAIIVLRDYMNDIEMTGELRCLAEMRLDTIRINISCNSGFSGKGMNIVYTGKYLKTNIYEFTDVIDPSVSKPVYTMEKQKLALNKSKFVVGDSLYGYVYARMIDEEKENIMRQDISERRSLREFDNL